MNDRDHQTTTTAEDLSHMLSLSIAENASLKAEIARMHEAVAGYHRALWCLAHDGGGEVRIPLSSAQEWRGGERLHTSFSPDQMHHIIAIDMPTKLRIVGGKDA